MTLEQIKVLRTRSDYHMMVAFLGEYDDSVDYMGPGDKDNWKRRLIPRTIYGIDCNIAAYKHDYKYYLGGTEKVRLAADRDFYFDLIEIIETHKCSWMWGTRWLHFKLARRRANKYYLAVKTFGGHGSFNYHDEDVNNV